MIGDDGDDDKGNLNQAILQGNGNTDFQKLSHHRAAGLEVGFLQRDTLSLQNHEQRHDYADCLGYRCTQRCSGRSKTEHTHKQIVQADIGGTGYGDKVHGTFAVTHTTENRTDNVIRCDKGDADKTDGQVRRRAAYGFCRSGHCRNDRANQHKQDCHQRDGYRHKECHSIAHILCSLVAVTRTDGLPDADGRSHRKPDDHHREHVHDL